jgi:hypothetical protein
LCDNRPILISCCTTARELNGPYESTVNSESYAVDVEARSEARNTFASRAILYRQPGLALRLQRAGDGLSDELDEEEEINQ